MALLSSCLGKFCYLSGLFTFRYQFFIFFVLFPNFSMRVENEVLWTFWRACVQIRPIIKNCDTQKESSWLLFASLSPPPVFAVWPQRSILSTGRTKWNERMKLMFVSSLRFWNTSSRSAFAMGGVDKLDWNIWSLVILKVFRCPAQQSHILTMWNKIDLFPVSLRPPETYFDWRLVLLHCLAVARRTKQKWTDIRFGTNTKSVIQWEKLRSRVSHAADAHMHNGCLTEVKQIESYRKFEEKNETSKSQLRDKKYASGRFSQKDINNL